MLRLKSHNTAPPGGFCLIDKSTQFKAHGWSVRAVAALWYQEQLRRGIPYTIEQSARDVEGYTCEQLMKTPHWNQWVEMDKPFLVTDVWNSGDIEQIPFKLNQPAFIQLGRYGDLILLFPAFQEMKRRTGETPVIFVSREYANIFDGVSYSTPLPVPWDWWDGVPKCRQLSKDIFGQETVLQCHGSEWGVDMALSSSFMESMWLRAGFTKEEMLSLPLEFDLRDNLREQKLVKKYKTNRPLVLTKFFGVSSPFHHSQILMQSLSFLQGHCDIVNLDTVKSERIFDLLGLIDVADLFITIDTATLHLAAASKTPYIAFSTEGWSGSIPKGNCVFNCRYSEVVRDLDKIASVVRGNVKI